MCTYEDRQTEITVRGVTHLKGISFGIQKLSGSQKDSSTNGSRRSFNVVCPLISLHTEFSINWSALVELELRWSLSFPCTESVRSKKRYAALHWSKQTYCDRKPSLRSPVSKSTLSSLSPPLYVPHLNIFQFRLTDTRFAATSRHTTDALRLYHCSLPLTATTISLENVYKI